jgi:CBS domain-containing protein
MLKLSRAIREIEIGSLDLGEYVLADVADPVADVIRQMRDRRSSTALVIRDGQLAGIFTERDVLKRVMAVPGAGSLPMGAVMTADPVTLPPQASILQAVRIMRTGWFRDVPVVDSGGKIVGNLTDNAIVRHIADRLSVEVMNLPPDSAQVAQAPEGA